MKPKDALNDIMSDSGMSKYAVAKAMGRHGNYVYSLMNRTTNPSYEVLTSIADICGYDLALIKRDGSNTIILNPPKGE